MCRDISEYKSSDISVITAAFSMDFYATKNMQKCCEKDLFIDI